MEATNRKKKKRVSQKRWVEDVKAAVGNEWLGKTKDREF